MILNAAFAALLPHRGPEVISESHPGQSGGAKAVTWHPALGCSSLATLWAPTPKLEPEV